MLACKDARIPQHCTSQMIRLDHNLGSRSFHSLEVLKIFLEMFSILIHLKHLQVPHEAGQFPQRTAVLHWSASTQKEHQPQNVSSVQNLSLGSLLVFSHPFEKRFFLKNLIDLGSHLLKTMFSQLELLLPQKSKIQKSQV